MTYSDIGTIPYRCQPLYGTISYLRQQIFSYEVYDRGKIGFHPPEAAFTLFSEHGFFEKLTKQTKEGLVRATSLDG